MPSPEDNPNRGLIPYVIRNIIPPTNIEPYARERTFKGTNLVRLSLSMGVSPLGPPEIYVGSRGRTYHVDASLATRYVRERWELSDTPYIVFSNGGSHELLERVITQLLTFPGAEKKEPTVRVWGITPQFPEIVTFINRSPRMIYGAIPPTNLENLFNKEDEEQRFDNRVSILARSNRNNKNVVMYIDNPNNPTGDVAKPETIKKLVEHCANKRWLVIIDEAFGDALEDNQSAIPLTESYANLIVLRSFSKIIALPGERIGYAVMSPEVGERFHNVRRILDLSASAQELADKILEPKTLQPFLAMRREQLADINYRFARGLKNRGIRTAHKHPNVPITFMDTGKQGVYENLERWLYTEVASGTAFFDTDNRLTGRYLRVTTPADQVRRGLFLRRLVGAIKAA